MRLLQVFNRYVHMGGEEKSVDRIYRHLEGEHEMRRCFFDSRDWKAEGAPGKVSQLRRTLYNPDSRVRFDRACDEFRPDAALFHNVFPVGSPSVYHAAHLRKLPVVHYIHNFRPFSVGGTLYLRGGFLEEALRGDYLREIRQGAWQESKLKSAVMALVLRRLHRSGWLDGVKAWVCISEFLRDKLVHGVGLPPDRVFALRHSWDAMPQAPETDDAGYYLFLGRLVEVKGLETLLQAWNVLQEKLGERTPELWIAGEGPLDEMISAAATWMPKVRHLGLIGGELKKEAIRRCRAMLAPSLWWEPLGLVTYEAYDFAKPMLAASSGGLSETVVDGTTGFLHEPGSVASLVESVIKLEAMSPDARADMGSAGRRWLLANAAPGEWQRRFAAILKAATTGQ